jgi:AcrR family transcriptional regulator
MVIARMAATDSDPRVIQPLFPRLAGGPGKLPPEKVAAHQRARLEGAMVEAVARHGYAGTTLRELVALAGVSKSTFYEHFESKQDCFFATFEEIVELASKPAGEAYLAPGTIRERLVAGLRDFMALAVEEPAAAWLATVESLTLGSAGVAPRERGWLTFERMFKQSFDDSPSRVQVSERTVRAIVAGIRGTVYRHLRNGAVEELPDTVEELADWTLGYQRRESAVVGKARRAAEKPPAPISDDEKKLSWDEPPDSRRSRMTLTQRERIIRAAARVVFEVGYESLSVPAISGAAGVSNQTFYENFPSKRDAFLEAFEVLAQEAFAVSIAAIGSAQGPEAIGLALRAMLEHVAENGLFARIGFFELASAGPVAMDRADTTIDQFTSVLDANVKASGVGKMPSPVVLAAIGTGIWAVIQHELAHDRAAGLPELAPELARIAVAPLG